MCYSGDNISEQSERPENAGRTIVVILPTAVFCHVVCVSREGGYLLLHAAEPNLHIERNGDGGGIFVSGDNDTDLFFIGIKAVA